MNAISDASGDWQDPARPARPGRLLATARAWWLGLAGVLLALSTAVGVLPWSLLVVATYPLGVLAILLLERIAPADQAQKVLSPGLANDAVWVVMKAGAEALLVGSYVRVLEGLYAQHLSSLTLDVARDVPGWARIAVALVVLDFLRWAQHVLHHQVPALWYLHAVHHSQRELNQFSDYRVHPGEYLVRPLVMVLPMLMLSLPVPEIAGVTLALKWHGHLQHANIRSHWGPLRFLLVTPQSHRIHHSIEPRHAGRNYGAVLSVWDRLFGTQHREHREYPATGIADAHFPHERAGSAWSLIATPLRQTWYPLRQLGAMVARRA